MKYEVEINRPYVPHIPIKGESQSQIRDEIFKDIKEILNILI